MSTELVEGLMAYEAQVKRFLDWRLWSDCFGVQVGHTPGSIVPLRGTVVTRASPRWLLAGMRYQDVKIESPIFLTSLLPRGE